MDWPSCLNPAYPPHKEQTIDDITLKLQWYQIKIYNEESPVKQKQLKVEKERLIQQLKVEKEREHQRLEREHQRLKEEREHQRLKEEREHQRLEREHQRLKEEREHQRLKEEREHQLKIMKIQLEIGSSKKRQRSTLSTLSFPQAKRVSAIGKTPSSATESQANQKSLNYSMHTNWFAVALYSAFNKYEDHNTGNASCTVNNLQISVSFESIHLMVKQYRQVVQHRIDNDEAKMTALLCDFFSTFLIPSSKKSSVTCLHQYPIFGQGEKADVYVAVLNNNCDILRSILIGDMKPHVLVNSLVESIAYGSRVLHISHHWDVQLMIAYTCHNIKLQVIQSVHEKMAIWNVCQVEVGNPHEMKKFFFILYVAVNYLIEVDISASYPVYRPLPDITITAADILSPDERTFRVFKHSHFVYKLYDTNHCLNPNLELIKSLDLLNGLELGSIDQTGRFTFLKYEHFEGSHFCACKEQFSKIASILSKLHQQGYVHSDIRAANLVFSACDNEAIIIDFDLTEREFVKYPSCYLHDGIYERHPDAKAGEPRRKDHDIHSLKYVIEQQTGETLPIECTTLQDIQNFFSYKH